MAAFRIDTMKDDKTGHVCAEIRRDGGEVVARSGPVFASEKEAEERLIEAISKAWPAQPADPVYPANGS